MKMRRKMREIGFSVLNFFSDVFIKSEKCAYLCTKKHFIQTKIIEL